MIITTLLFYLYRNDSINTGYMDPHNIEHSVATAVSTFRVASHSVSDVIARILMLHMHRWYQLIQVRAWPGQKFPIELTAWDQFSQPTMANAHLQFTTTLQVIETIINQILIIINFGDRK